MRAASVVALFLCACALGACAAFGLGEPTVQRAAEGPSPLEVHDARFVRGYARPPSFEESELFRQAFEERVTAYLTRHPDLATSERALNFRLRGRVAVGMSKDEVTVLVSDPDSRSSEAAAMQKVARQFWPMIQPRAQEMWLYPGGWAFYFAGDRLVDIVVTGKEPL